MRSTVTRYIFFANMAATKPEVVSVELSSYLTLRNIFKFMVNMSYSRSKNN